MCTVSSKVCSFIGFCWYTGQKNSLCPYIVKRNAIVSPAAIVVGSDAQVRIGRTNYAAKISAIGRFDTVE